MRRMWMAGLAVLALTATPALLAQDKSPPGETRAGETPRQKFEAISAEFQKARTGGSAAAKAKSGGQARGNRVNPTEYAERMIALAESAPEDQAAVDALLWCINNARASEASNRAMTLLAEKHASNPKVAQITERLQHAAPLPAAEKLLRGLASESKERGGRGYGMLALGQFYNRAAGIARTLKDRPEQAQSTLKALGMDEAAIQRFREMTPEGLTKKSEEAFERVINDYADVGNARRPLGPVAQGILRDIRDLNVGQPFPFSEIAGEDIAGKRFELSDFKGKVVVVDFYGDW